VFLFVSYWYDHICLLKYVVHFLIAVGCLTLAQEDWFVHFIVIYIARREFALMRSSHEVGL